MRLELKPHEAFVANHPRIVTRFDHIRISRPQLGLRAILVQDAQTPGVNNAHVSCLAKQSHVPACAGMSPEASAPDELQLRGG